MHHYGSSFVFLFQTKIQLKTNEFTQHDDSHFRHHGMIPIYQI